MSGGALPVAEAERTPERTPERLDAYELRLLRALGAAMSAGLPPSQFLGVFSDEFEQLVPHHHIDIEILSEDHESFVYLGANFRGGPYAPADADAPGVWLGFSSGGRYAVDAFTIRNLVRSGEPQRFDDYRTDPRVAETSNPFETSTFARGLRYGLMLPLKVGGEVFGMMCCGRGEPFGPFGDDEFELARAMVERLAPFIQTFRTYLIEHELRAQVEAQRDFVTSLNAVSRAVAGCLDERTVLATCASELRRLITCAHLEVRVLAESDALGCRVYRANSDGSWSDLGERRVVDQPGASVLRQMSVSSLDVLPASSDGSRSTVLTVPLTARSKLIGSLSLIGSDTLASEEAREVAGAMADQIGPFLESVRVTREAEKRGRELGAVEERARLAREMHDSLVQILCAAKELIGVTDQQSVGRLDELIANALTESRALLWTLRENEVSPDHLVELLRGELTGSATDLAAESELSVAGDTAVLDAGQATALHAIVRQLLGNVRRHSRARRVSVALNCRPSACQVDVADDGIGMTPGLREHRPGPSGGGAGLFLVRERARLAGGELAIESAPGAGTTVHVSLPSRQPALQFSPFLTIFGETEPLLVAPRSGELVRVLLVDDHEVVREGFRRVFDATADFTVVGEAATSDEALQVARRHQPDLVLLDVNLPQQSGTRLVRDLLAERPGAQVLAMSAFQSPVGAYVLIEAGARGFVSMAIDADRLLRILRALANGEPTVEPILVSPRPRLSGTPRDGGELRLSERERQVLRLMRTSSSYREIGQQLFLSEKTVQYHVRKLFDKLGVHSRSAAVSRAIELGLLPPYESEPDQG